MYPKDEKKVVVDEMEVKGTSFDALGTTMMTSTDDQRGIWEIDIKAQQQNLLHEMNDSSSLFYNDQFPSIPDFPCMSSSSSTSSNPAPAKPMSSACTTSSSTSASSTSSASSWAVLKSEYATEEEGEVPLAVPPLETTADGSGSIDCMDVMENFGYMDLIDGNDIWDPSSIFEQDPGFQGQDDGTCFHGRVNSNGSEVVQEGEMMENGKLDDLGVMFFDWLKSNKEVISAEDMRNIKLKRSTIESASKRLGSSKEGKKQLLKLILEWVQQNQLQRKNSGGVGAGGEFSAIDATTTNNNTQYPLQQYPGLAPAPQQPPVATTQTPPPPFDSNTWVPPNDMWIPPSVGYPSYMTDQTANGMALVGSVTPQAPYPYSGGGGDPYMNPYNNAGSGEYQVLESAPSWNPSQITMAGSPYNNQFLDVGNNYGPQVMPLAPGYPDQYPYNPQVYAAGGGGGEQRVMRLGSSATKEARKKRMARQRKTYFQHHHHSRQNHHNHMGTGEHHQHAHTMLMDDTCSGKSHGGNWLYWPSPPSATTLPPPPVEVSHRPSARPQQPENGLAKQTSSSDKRQGLKTEKNLKFLLQKVLKQSDVGSLGRIVLPKKEAESHLPDLESRDGISIAMEDIGTSQVWNMRYRFWPNNKSRMYLLENTGDFVKVNGLQEGDFIVLYSDVKCGKYLIRGVKVRQQASGKSESKKPVKRSYRSTTQPGRSSSTQPAKIAAL